MIFPTVTEADERGQPVLDPPVDVLNRPTRPLAEGAARCGSRRLLFLDDDPARAETFLIENPQAVWVQTVLECVGRLAENWDEVHLDHDLGGKTFVDTNENDCGMEVIRWLCVQPRDHLRETLFFVHTHNSLAGLLMVLQMRSSGYKAEFRPFGIDPARLLADECDRLPQAEPLEASRAERRAALGHLWRFINLLKGGWTSLLRHHP